MANILPVHQMIERPDLVGNFARGLGLGNQQRALNEQRADEQTLRQLAPQIIAGDQNAFAAAAAIDPERAGKAQGAGDAMLRRLEPAIAYMKNAQKTANPKAMQAAWEQVRPYFAQVSGHEPPPDFVTAQPHFDQLELKIQMAKAAKLGGTDTPTGYRELEMKLQAAGYKPGTPEYENAVRVALGTEGRASSAGMQTIDVEQSDGSKATYTFDPRRGTYVPFGGAPASPSAAPPTVPGRPDAGPQGGQPFFDDVRAVIAPLGGILGSTTGGQHNAGSLHPDGNAVDIPMGASASPEAKANAAQMIAALEAKGYRVRDERTRPAGQAVWSGPHLHAERVSGGGGGSAGGPVPGVGMTPGARAYATESGQLQAKTEYLPTVGQLEADNAAAKRLAEGRVDLALKPEANALDAEGEAQKVTAKADAEKRVALRQSLPDLRQTQAALLDAYNGFKNGTYTSGLVTGNIPAGMQSANNQYLLTTINDQILATAERMKGTLSDKDVAFLKSATFNLENDEQANMQIIGRKLAIINDAIARASAAGQPAASGAAPAPRRAKNPQTGEVLVLVNGQWVPE